MNTLLHQGKMQFHVRHNHNLEGRIDHDAQRYAAR